MSWGIDGLFPRPSHHPVFNTQERKTERRFFNVLQLHLLRQRGEEESEGSWGLVVSVRRIEAGAIHCPFVPQKLELVTRFCPLGFFRQATTLVENTTHLSGWRTHTVKKPSRLGTRFSTLSNRHWPVIKSPTLSPCLLSPCLLSPCLHVTRLPSHWCHDIGLLRNPIDANHPRRMFYLKETYLFPDVRNMYHICPHSHGEASGTHFKS